MTEPTNADLMRVLGRLEANVENSVHTQQQDMKRASESRTAIHEKIDKTNSVVQTIAQQAVTNYAELSFKLQATTDMAVQARDGLNSFRAKFEKEAAPILEGVGTFREEVEPLLAATRTVKNWAAFFAFLAGTGVISAGAVITFFNESLKLWMKHWLGI